MKKYVMIILGDLFFMNKERILKNTTHWYEWRQNADKKTMLLLSLLFACLTGIMGQIVFTIPGTTIITTPQVLVVLMAGIILGEKYGAISMVLFMIIGLLGVPWFSFGNGGFNGAAENIGFLSGFIFAATFTGYVFDNYQTSHKPLKCFLLMLFADIILIHTCGCIGLFIVLITRGVKISLISLLVVKFVPNIVRNTLEALITTLITSLIAPKDPTKLDTQKTKIIRRKK